MPCTLVDDLVDFSDGHDEHAWTCVVFGADAWSAGSAQMYATVWIDGMEHVLAQNPNIESGKTTVLAQGAALADFTLTITGRNTLTFGEVTSGSVNRRRLSAKSGNLSILVVRVTTADRSLTKQKAEISGDIFGTAGSGDTLNLKGQVASCSNSVATVSPGVGTGSTCVDDQNAVFNIPRDDGLIHNCDFFNDYQFSRPGDLCDPYGTGPQVDNGKRCCFSA